MWQSIKEHKIITGLVVIVIVGGGWWLFSGNGDPLAGVETAVVQEQDIQQIVSETGRIEPASDATLSFAEGGRVDTIAVDTGSTVASGSVVARLEKQAAKANLRQAEATLSGQRARLAELRSGPTGEQFTVSSSSVSVAREQLSAAENNLQQVRKIQNEAVRSAREDLYTSNLEAYLVSGEDENSDDDFTPPTVSGTYNATTSGSYRLAMYSSAARSGWSYRISGLGSGSGKVSTSQPQPIGHGLYVEFPDNFAGGKDMVWEIPVPNTRASGYTTLKNALESAKDSRASAIEKAQNEVANAQAAFRQAQAQADLSTAGTRSEQIAAQEAAVAAAEAQVEHAEATLADRTLRAPFAGTITDVRVTAGEMVTAGQAVATLISDDPYEVTVAVPEVDTAQLDVGDPVEITLDAFAGETFTGKVDDIAPVAKTVEGLQTIETTVSLTETDPRIRAGLSADVDITAATSSAVPAVPTRAVQEDANGQTFVYQVNTAGDGLIRTNITTGLEGSDGRVEVVDGLSAAEEIVTFLTEDMRSELEASGRIE